MSATMHSLIFRNLLDALAAIRTDDGYNLTAAKVCDHFPSPGQKAPLPLAAVVPGEIRGRQLPCNVTEKSAQFSVVGWVDAPYGADPLARAGQWQRDLEAAVTADRTRGGRAIDTRIASAHLYPERDGAVTHLMLQVQVTFHE